MGVWLSSHRFPVTILIVAQIPIEGGLTNAIVEILKRPNIGGLIQGGKENIGDNEGSNVSPMYVARVMYEVSASPLSASKMQNIHASFDNMIQGEYCASLNSFGLQDLPLF
jgi:hypothetical protein